jgi:hypothetical protein
LSAPAAHLDAGTPPCAASEVMRCKIEAQLDTLSAVAEVLDADVSAIEVELKKAREAVKNAIDAVMAAHVANVLADARELRERLDALLALLSVAKERHITAEGVWPFLMRPGHEVNRNAPALKSASCLLRAWRFALEADANAEPDLAAATALEKAEADRDAAETAARKVDEERRIAEREAAEAAYRLAHPREPLTPFPRTSDNVLPR